MEFRASGNADNVDVCIFMAIMIKDADDSDR